MLGYCEPPAGVTIREGLHYNPYFPGGAISMARAIYDEVVEYEDGTPNNASQLAKDVAQFLAWSSYPEFDERKKMGIKTVAISTMLLGLSVWWKRFKWSYLKSKKIVYKPLKVSFFVISKAPHLELGCLKGHEDHYFGSLKTRTRIGIIQIPSLLCSFVSSPRRR